jgi:hypothetical protein
LATALTGSLASDGQTTATGNLKMGNNRITGLADGIAATDAATVNQITTAGATYLLKASNLSDVANATTARGNLTAAKSGANSDITSLTGLTTPLTVAQGGTGAATLTANNVLLGNGTSAPQFVAPSTSGNVLVSNGTTWVSSSLPTGSVLQVVSATYSTQTSTTSASFTDTGLSVAITPKFSSSKILVCVTQQVRVTGTPSSGRINIVRGSTEVFTGSIVQLYTSGSDMRFMFAATYLDSPATTSSTTYKTQQYVNEGTIQTQESSSTSTITLLEIAG